MCFAKERLCASGALRRVSRRNEKPLKRCLKARHGRK